MVESDMKFKRVELKPRKMYKRRPDSIDQDELDILRADCHMDSQILKKRKCLKCDKLFDTTSSNRICVECTSHNEENVFNYKEINEQHEINNQ